MKGSIMKIRSLILTIIFLVVSCGPLAASTITYLYGDRDGFGINVQEGASFDFQALQQNYGTYSEFPTDEWSSWGTLSLGWTHKYSLDDFGPLTSASLEIFTGGQGDYGASQLYLGTTLVDTISGDGGNFAHRHVLDLSPFLDLLDGSDTFKLVTALSSDGWVDNWVLDYSALTVSDSASVSSVPLPSSLLLLAGGCLGLWSCRKGRRRKK